MNSKRVVIFALFLLFMSIAAGFLCEKPVYANTGELRYRPYNSTQQWSTFGVSVPLPSGFVPLGYDSHNYWVLIINPTTGEIQFRPYNSTQQWSTFGVSVPIPSGFVPLGYDDHNYWVLIINPTTGAIQYRPYNSTQQWSTWGVSVPIPSGFLPLGYDSHNYWADIIEATLSSSVTTQNATNLTGVTATVNGTLSSLGLPAATQYGFQWGPPSNPYQNQTSCGVPTTTGSFTLNLTNLTEATLYYVRAYATNALGTRYGNQITFTTHGLPHISIDSSNQNQSLSELTGNNNLIISGTLNDPNVGYIATIKYTIEGLSNHTDISLSPAITASGSSQPFSYQVPINNSIPEGAYILDIWAVDNYGQSAVTKLNFTVDKSAIGSNGEPVLRVVNSEGKAFNVDVNTGSYTDVTSSFLVNNTGTCKPFYTRQLVFNLFGTPQTFCNQSSAMAYIGNNTFRVVTSEGKAFDVNKTTGFTSDAPSTFLVNPGSNKPFFDRTDDHYFSGWGPFVFHDFGSTMAYIGNNTLRVVSSEMKAYDVNTLTGSFTEVTSSFLNDNNFGAGKPFFRKEYTYTIGGSTNTFYDFGSTMAYIDSNTLRVVTSEGKAFNVNITNGTWTDVTSTFLVNNFGTGKPFCLKTYPVTLNGTSYNFYDFGSAMAYTQSFNPDLAITSPLNQTALDEITLTGTVYDSDNHDVTVSATINGVTKIATVSNTTTPQTWSLTWNIATDNIPDGSYSNIVVQAAGGTGEAASSTYNGIINAFGTGSNIIRKTATYQYDDNGKLTQRRIVTNP